MAINSSQNNAVGAVAPKAKANHEVQECKRLLRLQYQAMASFKQLADPLQEELDKLVGFPELQDSDDALLLHK